MLQYLQINLSAHCRANCVARKKNQTPFIYIYINICTLVELTMPTVTAHSGNAKVSQFAYLNIDPYAN